MTPLRHRTQLAAAILAIGLLASACASDGSTDSSAGSSIAPDDTPAATASPLVVPEVLQFTAPLVGGGEFIGADYADKPTVFWFWAPT